MRIAVMTIKDSPNYGGILQAYALQSQLIKMGHECDLINYISNDFKQKFTFFGKPKRMKTIYWIYKKLQYPLMIYMMRKMMPFYERHMNVTKKFKNPYDLRDLNSDYDAFFVGSDQVWAADLNSYEDVYYLSFANSSKLLVAYAASFGRTLTMLNSDEKEFIRQNLGRFDFIGVREESGNEIIKKLSGRIDSVAVLDPTLLLNKNEWDSIAKKNKRDPYILCYLMQSKKNDREALELAKKISDESGLKIVKICRGLTSVIWGKSLYVPSVEEFLGLYSDADYVITNSFHGVAFSVNFKKQFSVFVEGDLKNGRNSRIYNICSKLGLLDRVHIVGSDIHINRSRINYDKVNSSLELLRKNSVDFIENTLIKQVNKNKDISE